MRHRNIILSVIVFLLVNSIGFSQATPLTLNEIKNVVGCWEGTLTYLDYSTNKPFSMSADLNVKQMGETNNFSFTNLYPKEPNANSIDTVSISSDGKSVNTEVLKSNRKLKDGSIEIITELLGEDGNNNKKAKFKFTYIIGSKVYEHKKEVQFIGTSKWILRHEYKYKSKPCL